MPWFEPQLFCYVCLGGVGPALALLGFIVAGKRGGMYSVLRAAAALIALTCFGGGLVALVARQPVFAILAPFAVTGAYVLQFLLPDRRSSRWVVSICRPFRLRSARFASFAACLVSLPLLGAALAFHAVDEQLAEPPQTWDLARDDEKDLKPVISTFATTDQGYGIPLYEPVLEGSPNLQMLLLAGQNEILDVLRLKGHVIAVAQGWQPCNCHGWTFTHGRFWIKSGDVDAILQGNGYALVHGPSPGDLAVYRDTAGKVTHTGVVRVVASGLVLVESKWGRLGRFVHPHDLHAYSSDQCFFYRSDRVGGHLLQGIGRDANLPLVEMDFLEGAYPAMSQPQRIN